MNSIDDQAKNEVRELLQDLVVSPVSKELGEEITKLSESLSELQKVPGKFTELIGLIVSKSKSISEKLERIDEISVNINSCEKICKDIKGKTNKLDDIQSKVIELLSILNDSKIDELRTKLLESNKQVVNIEKDIYKQNRTSFLIIITLSVINMLGLIGLIMIHVLY